MSEYNGHKNWNYWNVALWIGNDEGLYNLARGYRRRCKTKKQAAALIKQDLEGLGIYKTPDGAPYSLGAIEAAITEL